MLQVELVDKDLDNCDLALKSAMSSAFRRNVGACEVVPALATLNGMTLS